MTRRELLMRSSAAATLASILPDAAAAKSPVSPNSACAAGEGRRFPPPSSISPEAQQALARPLLSSLPYPALNDESGWRAYIAARDEELQKLWDGQHFDERADAEPGVIAGVPVIYAKPKNTAPITDKVLLDIHGGGLILCGGRYLRAPAQRMALSMNANIISIDYRMPPDHPYPAGLNDCLAVYRQVIREKGAENVIVQGASAGGNLALALMLKARDEGLAMPAGLILMSPEADLTESGDSFQVLAGIDRLQSLMPVNHLYAAGASLSDPYLSPLFGDFSGGFPRTLIQSGTRDLFLSNAVRLHRKMRKAGVEAELHIWEALPHGKFFTAPEDDEIDEEMRHFIISLSH